MPQSLHDFAAEVVALESSPPDEAAAAALERAIAAAGWATPSEREAAQALVLRLAKVRLSRLRPALAVPRPGASGPTAGGEGLLTFAPSARYRADGGWPGPLS
jgi:hypothetical protein